MRYRKDRHDLQELVRLHRLNVTTRAAARAVGMSRNTLWRYHLLLREAGLLDGAPYPLSRGIYRLTSPPVTLLTEVPDVRHTDREPADPGVAPQRRHLS
jgi:hypothetical protein